MPVGGLLPLAPPPIEMSIGLLVVDVALRQGGVVRPDVVDDLGGADLGRAERALAGPPAVEVGEHGASLVLGGDEADEALGRVQPAAGAAARGLVRHLHAEHPLLVRLVLAVERHLPLLQTRHRHPATGDGLGVVGVGVPVLGAVLAQHGARDGELGLAGAVVPPRLGARSRHRQRGHQRERRLLQHR